MKQVFLAILSFVGVFLFCELFARGSHLVPLSYTDFRADIGRSRKKNTQYVYFNEGFGIGRFNEYGYIGEGRSPKKEANSIRIALVGDSYVEAFQVFERDHFAVLTEQILNREDPYHNYEVLNFGCNGYDIGDIYVYNVTFVEKFNPDIVLYVMGLDDLKPLNKDVLRPKIELVDDSISISYDYPADELNLYTTAKPFLQNSAMINMIDICRKKYSAVPLASVLLDKLYMGGDDPSQESEGTSPNAEKIDPLTLKIMTKLGEDRVILVNRDEKKFPTTLVNAFASAGSEVIDLYPLIKSQMGSEANPRYWSATNKTGHWNHRGHHVVARILSNVIRKRIES